jgi:hypothetical protein
MANPRYTSLIPNPPAAPATSTPGSRARRDAGGGVVTIAINVCPLPGALNIWECLSVSDRVAYPCGKCLHCEARAIAHTLLHGVAS